MIGRFLAWCQDLLRSEPVLILALVQATLGMAVGFGLGWTGEQVALVTAFAAAILGVVARQRVTPV
jgi:uncharacterized membrane protein